MPVDVKLLLIMFRLQFFHFQDSKPTELTVMDFKVENKYLK